MRVLALVIFAASLMSILCFSDLASAYSRITSVNIQAPLQGKVNQQIEVQAEISTGNNVVESVHNVSVTLLFPPGGTLVSGSNPLCIGEMGPGPANATCLWTIQFNEPEEYILEVNASCINTQHIPQWMNASTSIRIYGPPYVEFEHIPASEICVNDTVIFNAFKSYAQGPDSEITEYVWDFGDGTKTKTTIAIVEHRFSQMGNYSVSLNVTDSEGLSNMNITQISVSLFGDLNSDGRVNIEDIAIVASSYGSRVGEERWKEKADLNHDGVVDIIDVSTVAKHYGL